MAAKKISAMDFIIAQLKKNKKASYADIRDAATKKKLTIYPIMYGRAKALLGLVPVAARGSKKKKTAAKRGPGRPPKVLGRGPGRPRKNRGDGSPIDTLTDLLSGLKQQERANTELRSTLEKIRDLIDRVV